MGAWGTGKDRGWRIEVFANFWVSEYLQGLQGPLENQRGKGTGKEGEGMWEWREGGDGAAEA